MKLQKIFFWITILFVIISCSDKKEDNLKIKDHDEVPQYVKMNNDAKATDSLFDLAINKGDTKAYNTVAGNYILDENFEDLLYYSLIMANKYNSSEAHYHIFLILSRSNDKQSFDELDNKTKSFALYHLVKSYELGYESSKYSINEVLGKGNQIMKSDFYISKYAR